MRTFIAALCLLTFSVGAQSKAKPLEIDTVILMKKGDGYVMQYSAAGRDESGRPIIKAGDQVPLLSDADRKAVKPIFDAEAARAKPATVDSIVLATDVRGSFFVQHTAAKTNQGFTFQVVGPLTELPSAKERKEAQAVFALAKRARTGK